jgi:hypothetical protein
MLGSTTIKDYKHQDIDSEIKPTDSAVVKMNKLLVIDVKNSNELDRLELETSLTVPDASYFLNQLDEDRGVNADIMVSILLLSADILTP